MGRSVLRQSDAEHVPLESGARFCYSHEAGNEGLPVWSHHVGDPILLGNRARRVDYALFMVHALTDDSLVHEAPAIVCCRTPSALAHGRWRARAMTVPSS